MNTSEELKNCAKSDMIILAFLFFLKRCYRMRLGNPKVFRVLSKGVDRDVFDFCYKFFRVKMNESDPDDVTMVVLVALEEILGYTPLEIDQYRISFLAAYERGEISLLENSSD